MMSNGANSKKVKQPHCRLVNANANNDATLRVFAVCNAMHRAHWRNVAQIGYRVCVVVVNKARKHDSKQRRCSAE